MPSIFKGNQFILSNLDIQIPEDAHSSAPNAELTDVPLEADISSVAAEDVSFNPAAEEPIESSSQTPEAPPTPPVEEPEPQSQPELVTPEIQPPQIDEREIEQIRQNAFNEAYQAAYYDTLNQKKQDISKMLLQVNRCIEDMQRQQNEYFNKYAAQLKVFAIEIAKKILLDRISEDDLSLQKLIMSAVEQVKKANWITVEVSEHLVGLVEALKNELSSLQNAEVLPRSMPDGAARINTESGTLDVSVHTQIDNLRKAFEMQ